MTYLEKTYEFRSTRLKTNYILYDIYNINAKLKVTYYSDYVRIFNSLPIKNTSTLGPLELRIL